MMQKYEKFSKNLHSWTVYRNKNSFKYNQYNKKFQKIIIGNTSHGYFFGYNTDNQNDNIYD